MLSVWQKARDFLCVASVKRTLPTKLFNYLLAHSYLRQQIVSLLLAYVNKLLAHPKQNIFAYATSALTKTKRTVSDPNVKKIKKIYFWPIVAYLERLYGKKITRIQPIEISHLRIFKSTNKL